MKTMNLPQLEAHALMKDQLNSIKGGGNDTLDRGDKCASCVCPMEKVIDFSVYIIASQTTIEPGDPRA